MSLLTLPPSRAPMVGANGLVSPDWYRFFHDMVVRAGGVSGSGTDDLSLSQFEDAGIEETKAWVYQLADEVRSIPPVVVSAVEAVTTELNELRETVAVLRRQIEDIQQGTVI